VDGPVAARGREVAHDRGPRLTRLVKPHLNRCNMQQVLAVTEHRNGRASNRAGDDIVIDKEFAALIPPLAGGRVGAT